VDESPELDLGAVNFLPEALCDRADEAFDSLRRIEGGEGEIAP